MIHLQRGPAPDFWTRDRVEEWTERWLAKNCESSKWAWPQYQKRGINAYAVEKMEIWHHAKCAFCEAPLMGNEEIEHFRAKAKPRRALAAFVWRNLFLSCTKCNQSKGADDHEGCLKPDREDPADYLWVNPVSLKIEPRPGISAEAKQRAQNTIDRYKLDRPELTWLYKEHLHVFVSNQSLPLAGLVHQSQQGNLPKREQIPFQLAALQALTQPEQPFSLMVKSLLEYHGAI